MVKVSNSNRNEELITKSPICILSSECFRPRLLSILNAKLKMYLVQPGNLKISMICKKLQVLTVMVFYSRLDVSNLNHLVTKIILVCI